MSEKFLLNAANGQQNQKIPKWLMRQAGRYLPEYREIRKKNPTLTMFKTPKIAAEITLQPLKRFNLDGAILYADILLIPDAYGLGLHFVEGEGPRFEKTIRNQDDLKLLPELSSLGKIIEKLSYVGETVERVVSDLPRHVTMLGFAGAPFTVASYVIEGGSSSKSEFFQTKKLLYTNPNVFHALMDHLTQTTKLYLDMQIQAGVQVVQLFESWSGALSRDEYVTHCFPYMQQLIEYVKEKKVPVILFMGTGSHLLQDVCESLKPNIFSADWRMNLQHVSETCSKQKIGLQGNLDPLVLFAEKSVIEQKARTCLEVGRKHKQGFIFNLGHGINQHTPLESVQTLINTIDHWVVS